MLLDRRLFFVKERVAVLKLTDTYDIFDPQTNQQIGIAKDEPSGGIKFLRLLVNKQLLPTTVNVYEQDTGALCFSIRKPGFFFRPKVSVFNAGGVYLGYFKGKILTIGGGFWIFDPQNQQVAEIKGDWKGWNFRFLAPDGRELGQVTKKWAGIGKELFTSADSYIISLSEMHGGMANLSLLLLAAGLAIDTVYKEKQ